MESKKELLTVIVDGTAEPLGFVEISRDSTLADARKLIEEELEGFPPSFRFMMKHENTLIKINTPQEGKKKISEFFPSVIIREYLASSTGNPKSGEDASSVSPSRPSAVQPVQNKLALPNSSPPSSPRHDMLNVNDSTYASHNVERHEQYGVTDSGNANNVQQEDFEALWKQYFGNRNKESIRLDELPFMIFSLTNTPPDPTSEYFKALNRLVIDMGPNAYSSEDFAQEDPKDVFIKIMKSFCPIVGLLERVTRLMHEKYFHGNISSRTAEDRIKSQKNGTFLLRFSTSQVGAFALTVKKDDQLAHYAILHTPDHLFKVGKETASSLEQLVGKTCRRLGLQYSCPSSPFEHTFDHVASLSDGYSSPSFLISSSSNINETQK